MKYIKASPYVTVLKANKTVMNQLKKLTGEIANNYGVFKTTRSN